MYTCSIKTPYRATQSTDPPGGEAARSPNTAEGGEVGHVGGLSQGVSQWPEGLAVVPLQGEAGLQSTVQAVVL